MTCDSNIVKMANFPQDPIPHNKCMLLHDVAHTRQWIPLGANWLVAVEEIC